MVNLAYMEELTGKDKDTLTEELRGVIFQNPLTDAWETADEYLSGNVREKLEVAARNLVWDILMRGRHPLERHRPP